MHGVTLKIYIVFCFSGVRFGGSVDASSYISRAIFCHLPSTEIPKLANPVSRLQDDCSRLAG